MRKPLVHRAILGIGLLVLATQTTRAQWVRTSGPPSQAAVYALTASSNANGLGIWAATSDSGVFVSYNSGTAWGSVNNGLTNLSMDCIAGVGSNVLAGTWGGGVFRTTDAGQSWQAVDSGMGAGGANHAYVNCFAVSGGNLYAATNGGVFLSTNGGTTWTAGDTSKGFACLAVSGSTIFAGYSGVIRGDLFVSTNNGASWTAADSGLTNNHVGALAVMGGSAFAGTRGGGVFVSTNSGTSWTADNAGLTDSIIYCFAVSGNRVFVGTKSRGVLLSGNNGMGQWTAVDSGLTDMHVWSLMVSGNNIYAGTDTSGVWRRPLSEMIGVITPEPQRGMAEQAGLRVRSAGRTSPKVCIEFSLPHSEQVTVALYDPSGHEVACLVNKHLGAGAYSVMWNTRGLAAGCYAVRMQAGSDSYVKSTVLLR